MLKTQINHDSESEQSSASFEGELYEVEYSNTFAEVKRCAHELVSALKMHLDANTPLSATLLVQLNQRTDQLIIDFKNLINDESSDLILDNINSMIENFEKWSKSFKNMRMTCAIKPGDITPMNSFEDDESHNRTTSGCFLLFDQPSPVLKSGITEAVLPAIVRLT